MKKRFVLKIIFDIVLIASLAMFIWQAVDYFSSAKTFFEMYELYKVETWREGGIQDIITALLAILCALFALMFFILYNFKDISYLCGSLIKEMKEHKEATKEERKQKKIEELEKQLNELKKDE